MRLPYPLPIALLLCATACGGGGGTPPAPPTITAIFPDGGVVRPGGTLQFHATVEEGSALQWNFPGATPATSTQFHPVITARAAGAQTGSVTATGPGGTSAPRSFSYTVRGITPPASLALHTIGDIGIGSGEPDDPLQMGIEPFMVLLNDELWISYCDEVTRQLKIAHASKPVPAAAGDWATHTITASGPINFSTTLTTFNGRLVVATIAKEGPVQIARALVPAPASNSDWQLHTLANAGEFAADVFVIPEGNHLAVGYWSGDPEAGEPAPIEIHLSSNATPSSAADWTGYDIEPDSGFTPVDLAILNGRLAATWSGVNGELRAGFAQVSAPAAASDWLIYNIDGTPNPDGPDGHIAVIDGHMMVIYHREGGVLSLARALMPDPDVASDWAIHTIDTDAFARARNAITVNDSRLTFSYFDTTNKHLKVARALSTSPTRQSDWEVRTVDSTPNVGRWSAMVFSPSGLNVAYIDEPNHLMKYAFGPGGW
ncbi:MAG: hypothetical protein ABI743_09725 [bacterium]